MYYTNKMLLLLLLFFLVFECCNDISNFLAYTVEPRHNDLRYNDIPDITMKILYPGKSYSKMYGREPR